MLRLFFNDDKELISKKLIVDVEEAFNRFELTGSKEEQFIIHVIDKGTYKDSSSFIDRFGVELYVSELSTGCKAAIVVMHNPTEIVDIKECGLNARDIIISICKNGNIVIEDNCITFKDYSTDGEIDVAVDEYRFHSVDRLNTYIQDERPFGISLGWDGVEHV